MGKIFYNIKVKLKILQGLIPAMLLFFIFPIDADTYASYGEFDLFNRGYESYLSYQPEKAVETFETFLKEFPDSSARDAAMFWLGKSFFQLKDFPMAEKVFTEIKQKFPESPFLPYVYKEVEILGKMNAVDEAATVIGDAKKREDTRESMPLEREEKAELPVENVSKSLEDTEKKEPLLQKDGKGIKKTAMTVSAHLEKDHGHLNEPDGDLKQPKDEIVSIIFEGKKYTAPQISEFMNNASTTLIKLGVKEVLWRTGNIYEDFINEQILYKKAERSDVKGAPGRHKELAAKYKLTMEEEDYLDRYLAISDLIGRKVENMPGKRVVESLAVSYAESDKNDETLLASELQAEAKRGRSFRDIYKLYPNVVKFAVLEFSDLEGWVKESIEPLQDGEASVVWTKDGYMILKPVVKRPSYGPFDDMQNERGDEMRALVKRWVDELRKEAKEIEFVRAE